MFAALARKTARFGASLAGALVFAAALAALTHPAGVASYSDAFFTRLWNGLSLDFGASTISGVASMAEIMPALRASLALLAPGLVLALGLGVPLGLMLADKKLHPFIVPLMHLGRAVPVFCVTLLIAVAIRAWFPGVNPGHDLSLRAAMNAGSAHAVIAALAAMAPLVLPIALAGAGAVAAVVSTAVGEAMSEPYRESLHRLGLSPREIMRHYVARRAFALAMGGLGDIVLALIAAAAIVERLFDWPGAGAEFIQAVALQNWPVVAALVFVIAIARLVADFAGAAISTAVTGGSR